MYVDGLWVQKEGASQIADFQPLLEEILDRTGLPTSLDGIYRWIAFLSSRPDPRVPVANRYFGLFQNGTWKVRGIELRRDDTSKWIKKIQREMLDLLADAPDAGDLADQLPRVHALLQDQIISSAAAENPSGRTADIPENKPPPGRVQSALPGCQGGCSAGSNR